MKKWPPLPKRVAAPGGPVTVTMVHEVECDEPNKVLFGKYSPLHREIQIRRMPDTPAQEWATFYHELTHAFLFDAGLHNLLAADMHEAVCDAVGLGRLHERRVALGLLE